MGVVSASQNGGDAQGKGSLLRAGVKVARDIWGECVVGALARPVRWEYNPRFVRPFDFRPLDLEGEMSPNVDL